MLRLLQTDRSSRLPRGSGACGEICGGSAGASCSGTGGCGADCGIPNGRGGAAPWIGESPAFITDAENAASELDAIMARNMIDIG